MNLWEFIYQKHIESIETILLYVLKSEGSSPGRQGFKMAVAADGTLFGSIGGGIMEHKFVEMARSRLLENSIGAAVFNQVHDKTVAKNQSGMICSGEQTIFLYPVKSSDIGHLRALINSLESNRQGTLHLTNDSLVFNETIPIQNYYLEEREDSFSLIEKTGYKHHLHIIGGGHCALAFAKLMRGMDFFISLYEEREGLNTVEQNTFVHEKTILQSYSNLGQFVESGDNVYVVIMTFGYRSDDTAFRALLGKKYKYLGMLGSGKKIEKMFGEYEAENLDISLLKNVHSPIGLQIKSQTPEEIAISIAAEIIAIKNKDQ